MSRKVNQKMNQKVSQKASRKLTLRGLRVALVLALVGIGAGFTRAAGSEASDAGKATPKPGTLPASTDQASDVRASAPTIGKVLDFLAQRKRLAVLDPSKTGEQIPWIALRQEAKTDASWILGLSKPVGILEKAIFSFSATGDGSGWVLASLSFTCAADFTETRSQMRKRLGKPKSVRKGAIDWQFPDGWGISLRDDGSGKVVIAGNPNEDIAD